MNKLKQVIGNFGMSSSSSSSATSQAPAAGKLDELGCDDVLDAAQFSYYKVKKFRNY